MNEFLNEMFKYYQTNGIHFSVSTYNPNNLMGKRVSCVNDLSLTELENIWSTKSLKAIPVINEKFFDLQFFAHFYSISDPQIQKKLLFNYSKYSGHNFNDTYKDFLDYLDLSNDKIVALFKDVHIETCPLDGFNLKEFNSFLLGCKIRKTERQDVIFEFIKLRRKEIKIPSLAPIVRDFLIDSHDESDLKRYFVFFPFLHAHFKDRNIDCFYNIAKLSTSTVFSPSKMIDSFCVDGYKSDNYLAQMRLLSQALKLQYGFISESVQSSPKSQYINTYLHNNPEFTQDKLTDIIVCFFNSIKENPAHRLDCVEHVDAWLRKYDLEHQLEDKLEIRKIVKI